MTTYQPTSRDRLSPEQALAMLQSAATAELMAAADEIRRRVHGGNTHFVHSLNLYPTNICENRCELCAFWRPPDAADAYILDLDKAREILRAAQDMALTDVHIVGGLWRELGLAYYESLIALTRQMLPHALIQGITAVEVAYLADLERISIDEALRRLKDAGLGALPGGGAEVFAPDIRRRICSRKISAEQWLDVHRRAHRLGLATNATMLFGHVEQPRDIIDHLRRLRDLQDETGGFRAFIPLPFHAAGTALTLPRRPGGHTITRVVALARIFLDNVPHVRVLANYIDRPLLAVLLHAGADDIGGTSLDERIARAAGAAQSHLFTSPAEMAAMVADLGLKPLLVNSVYEHAPASPDVEPRQPPPAASPARVAEALTGAGEGLRLSTDDAIALHDGAPFQRLGALAHRRRMQRVTASAVTFVLDRNISYTNVCQSGCKFCAFHVKPGSPGGFTLTLDQILEKVGQAVAAGATQIMLQGGLNPAIDLAFCEHMLSSIKSAYNVCLHSFSPAEVQFLAAGAGLSIRQTLQRLRAAGLDSLPGGGAEILVDDVRRRVSPQKISAEAWFEVMRTAHEIGLKSTATMVFGLGETSAQRVEHLVRIRDLQDATGGFTAFIAWSFQPAATQLPLPRQSAVDYLRLVALARLVLDNIPHIQAGWLTEGADVAQLALSFGADDFGGVLMEEHVLRATGVTNQVTASQVISLIGETGMTPVQRTTQYQPLHTFAAPARATV